MVLPLEILQNLLMGFSPIANLAQRYHSTGLNADLAKACRVFELYAGFRSVVGMDILEIGPGQTLEVLEKALASGAKSCTAIDVAAYCSVGQAAEKRISYHIYDGRRLPLEAGQFDLIWSHTAFEHLRYPAVTVGECFRVLRPGGTLVSSIDLGDHSMYGKTRVSPEQLFDSLRYPKWLWDLMKWNRSSYTNRLRKSEWMALFHDAGFVVLQAESQTSKDIASALPALTYLHRFSYDDAVTSVVTVCLEKPQSPAVASS
ncbi:MAG: class I SAM-dependent methyltransferase [Nitrospira sp.]|nr:class I SAM-dependent methyltransferase [Nitrospira sp.]